MPAFRAGRASKACDSCRKNKTRCYASDNTKGTCLRCETLLLGCSLESERHQKPQDSEQEENETRIGRPATVDTRLDRLEGIVEKLVNRLDSTIQTLALVPAQNEQLRRTPPPSDSDSIPAIPSFSEQADRHPAPVFLIRDACTDAGVRSPEQADTTLSTLDVISAGLVPMPTAHTLLKIFHLHYGRWVRFSDDISTEALLFQVRRSPLLLCSIFLIAVRHTTDQLADRLAPMLFEEAKRLTSSALLVVPQPIEFYQAAIILSLWSTTIGQVPLSIDSWMLTGFALQQALASPFFIDAFSHGQTLPVTKAHCDAWCLWNHLTMAHLQACVGMRRQAMLNQSQIDRCIRLLETDHANNYETRMVAEVQLFWVVYQQCCAHEINISETSRALQLWKHQWSSLFEQPRSQFLQMGFYFAHLFAYYQSFRSPQTVMNNTSLYEMVRLSKNIISIAIDTADERTRHLTDHIYHTVTFSALTLCQLLHNYESQLEAASYDLYALDSLVYTLINWFSSIGLRCHAAHILGDIVSVQFQKLRPNFQPAETTQRYDLMGVDGALPMFDEANQSSMGFSCPNFIGLDLFAVTDNAMSWPQCAE